MDDDIYDPKGDQRLSPDEVRVLKTLAHSPDEVKVIIQIGKTGIVARYLLAFVLGALSLIGATWALIDHMGKKLP